MSDCNFAYISAFEEDPSCDKLNQKTFDRVNDLEWVFGNFDFSNKLWTSREVYNGKFYLPTYKKIGVGDYVCCCGETVYNDNLVSTHRSALYRLYIPRIMTKNFNFYSDKHVKQFISEQLSSFCNIIDIQLRWLPDVYDLSAFVYLNIVSPIHLTPNGKTAICNLTCNKCHSNRVHVSQNAFWNLLPSDCTGIIFL